MLHRSLDDGAETEMSKLLEWAEERKLIDGRVHRTLMKEFSRRIESKARGRQATGGVLQQLKRLRGGVGKQGNVVSATHSGGGMSQTLSQPNLQTQVAPQPYHGQHVSPPPQWQSGISF